MAELWAAWEKEKEDVRVVGRRAVKLRLNRCVGMSDADAKRWLAAGSRLGCPVGSVGAVQLWPMTASCTLQSEQMNHCTHTVTLGVRALQC